MARPRWLGRFAHLLLGTNRDEIRDACEEPAEARDVPPWAELYSRAIRVGLFVGQKAIVTLSIFLGRVPTRAERRDWMFDWEWLGGWGVI